MERNGAPGPQQPRRRGGPLRGPPRERRANPRTAMARQPRHARHAQSHLVSLGRTARTSCTTFAHPESPSIPAACGVDSSPLVAAALRLEGPPRHVREAPCPAPSAPGAPAPCQHRASTASAPPARPHRAKSKKLLLTPRALMNIHPSLPPPAFSIRSARTHTSPRAHAHRRAHPEKSLRSSSAPSVFFYFANCAWTEFLIPFAE